MTPFEITGQITSVVAMSCNVFSYQQKLQKRLIIFQLLGGALFAISFFLLGATIGALLNSIAVIRAVMFLFSEKLNMSHPLWLCTFILCYISFYVLTFTAFGTEPTPIAFLIELLPIVGMTALSIGFMLDNPGKMRLLGLISSPAWLIYNIYYFSLGAIICELLSLISIFIGMIRHDKKDSAAKTNQTP